jgi:hypothetical protein
LVVVLRFGGESAGRCGERSELGEGGGEIVGPPPGGLQSQLGLAAVEGEAGGDVQEPIAQALGL